jgi:hypothetical protein
MGELERLEEKFQKLESGSGDVSESLAKGLTRLTAMLNNITEYSDNELFALSMIKTDPIMSEMTKHYEIKKKHKDRKHAGEILEAIRLISKALALEYGFEKGETFSEKFKSLFKRD